MSEIVNSRPNSKTKQRRNNLKPDLSEKVLSLSETPRTIPDSESDGARDDKPKGPMPKKTEIPARFANQENSKSSVSSYSVTPSDLSLSESSSSLEDNLSEEDQLVDNDEEPVDVSKLSINRMAVLDYDGKMSKQIKLEALSKKPKRLWSYIKKPMMMFKAESPKTAEKDDEECDITTSIDYVEGNYSEGIKKRIKKLTNLYMMLNDPEIGILKNDSKPKTTFTGLELFKWILGNFDTNEDDFLAFLGDDSKLYDEIDAAAICNILFYMGYIVPMEKGCSKFVADNSEYILQAPFFIPIAAGVPSDYDYSRYLVRRTNSNKFKLQDYELKALESLKKSQSSSWKNIEALAQKDTAYYKRKDKDEMTIFKLQQQTFWRVHRPPPESYDFLNQGMDIVRKRRNVAQYVRPKELYKQPRLKISKACKYIKDYCIAMGYVDSILWTNATSNPWISGDKSVWESDKGITNNEIKCWTTDINFLLQDPKGMAEFHQYLKNEFSQENLNFILSCRELEQMVVITEFDKLAKQIYKDYIMDGAPSEINIISSIRNNLIDVFEDVLASKKTLKPEHYNIYNAAAAHIIGLMEKDPYKRFCKVLRSKLSKSHDTLKSQDKLLK